MKSKTFKFLAVLSIIIFIGCSLNSKEAEDKATHILMPKDEAQETEPHRYGGWYCPDNLHGFPAVDIMNWQNVPVVNGRMSTEKDRDNGATLIIVDREKYPNAKPLDITMPRLAKIYNHAIKREDIIIVIQAINVSGDSIVGYRFLNGGNGSAWLKDIQFLSEVEIDKIPKARFVSHSINIKASQNTISEVMRNPKHSKTLRSIFDSNNSLNEAWRKTTNLNYVYHKAGDKIAGYAEILFGNFYVQNDFKDLNYTEKFLLLEDDQTNTTILQIVCGPFAQDFNEQEKILQHWGQKVKELSEL